jgi:hypothetical protein
MGLKDLCMHAQPGAGSLTAFAAPPITYLYFTLRIYFPVFWDPVFEAHDFCVILQI